MKGEIYKPCPKCGFLHLTTDEECPRCAKRAVKNEAEVTEKTAVEELPKTAVAEIVQEEAAAEVVINEDAEKTQKESILPIVTEEKQPKEPKSNGRKGLYTIIAMLIVIIVSLLVVIMQDRNPTIEVNNTTLQGNTNLAILTQETETTTEITTDTTTETASETLAPVSTTKKNINFKKRNYNT